MSYSRSLLLDINLEEWQENAHAVALVDGKGATPDALDFCFRQLKELSNEIRQSFGEPTLGRLASIIGYEIPSLFGIRDMDMDAPELTIDLYNNSEIMERIDITHYERYEYGYFLSDDPDEISRYMEEFYEKCVCIATITLHKNKPSTLWGRFFIVNEEGVSLEDIKERGLIELPFSKYINLDGEADFSRYYKTPEDGFWKKTNFSQEQKQYLDSFGYSDKTDFDDLGVFGSRLREHDEKQQYYAKIDDQFCVVSNFIDIW